MPELSPSWSRRRLLFTAAALPAGAILQGCHAIAAAAPGRGDEPTHAQTEGPFYRLYAPERPTLREAGMAGTPLLVSGRVVDHRGKPLAGALLDFWHCDGDGVYDTRGYRLRGYQRTDGDGRYQLDTIVPGLYTGRTRHVHVKLQPAGDDVPDAPRRLNLTTQLYFPGEPQNRADDLFDPSLIMQVDRDGDRQLARFDFVLDLG